MPDLISRQEAIDAIQEDADWLASEGSDWQVERMERDKSILRSLPSAQPNLQQTCNKLATDTNVLSNDCISRQAAIDELESYGEFIAVNIIKELPTVQSEPEEIARHIATILENEQDMRAMLKNAQPELLTFDGVVLHMCDPEKNPTCKKTGCYINGGECHMTTKSESTETTEDNT